MNNLILPKTFKENSKIRKKIKNATTQILGPVVNYNFPDWAFSMGAKWTVNYFEKLFKPVFCCLTGLHRTHYTVANLNTDHKNN